jgi:hypothetical protein
MRVPGWPRRERSRRRKVNFYSSPTRVPEVTLARHIAALVRRPGVVCRKTTGVGSGVS